MRLLCPADFVVARFPVPLAPDEVQLWFFSPDRETTAAARLPQLLSAYLDCTPANLRLGYGQHGKPFVAAPGRIEFNLSHSRLSVLVGISHGQELGVDIEAVRRRRPVLDLAKRFFTANEALALAGLPGELQQEAFLRLWSCKEAFVKALGRGLGFGLAKFDFAIDALGMPNRLNVIDASAGSAPEWQIVALQPVCEYVGAVAWRGPPRPLRAFRVMEA